jgi:hypothetical protein
MNIPATDFRTAVAIRNDTRTVEVTVTFLLTVQHGASATYAAMCPRCKTGAITVDVALAPDGSFAEAPACPTLCVSCEDRLDLIMEPEGDEPARLGLRLRRSKGVGLFLAAERLRRGEGRNGGSRLHLFLLRLLLLAVALLLTLGHVGSPLCRS